jgi:hypothetical protein
LWCCLVGVAQRGAKKIGVSTVLGKFQYRPISAVIGQYYRPISVNIGLFKTYRCGVVLMLLDKFIETIGVVSLMVDTGLARKYR